MECLNEDAKKKKDSFCTLGVRMIKPLLAPNFSVLSTSFMDPVGILRRSLTKEYYCGKVVFQ